jgi:pimeloyl-ACP methyl ester carboxylesterase
MVNSSERANQTTQLRDGRRLSFAEYGPADGIPTMLFGGASGRYLKPCSDEVLQKAGARLIIVERPGFGRSDFQPKRALLDWPDDVTQLADHLALARFAVVAGSQGGPYGAVCGYKIPERLASLTLVSALAPFDVPGLTEGMAPALAMLPNLARFAPFFLRPMQGATVAFIRRDPEAAVRRIFTNLPPADQAILQQPELIQTFVRDFPEAYRQGGRGAAHDIAVVCHPWGFRVEEIRATTFVWQGEADPNVPPVMGRYFAATIPNCGATFVPGTGHMLFYTHFDRVLRQAVSAFEARRAKE